MITKTTKTVEVPAYTYEDTVYECSQCKETFEEKGLAEYHEEKEHGATEIIDTNYCRFYRIETEESFEIFKRAIKKQYLAPFVSGAWKGPGLYGERTEEAYWGGSYETGYSYEPIGDVLITLAKEIWNLERKYSEIDDLSKR